MSSCMYVAFNSIQIGDLVTTNSATVVLKICLPSRWLALQSAHVRNLKKCACVSESSRVKGSHSHVFAQFTGSDQISNTCPRGSHWSYRINHTPQILCNVADCTTHSCYCPILTCYSSLLVSILLLYERT